MKNQMPFTPNGNFDALMRIYKGEVPPTQGVAIATDAGTSEGVKKSWLKRERAKQDADVDTLDKGKNANGGKGDFFGFDKKATEKEIAKALSKKYPNAEVRLQKDEPRKGEFAICVKDANDWNVQNALRDYLAGKDWKFTDRYEGFCKLDGDKEKQHYAFLSFKILTDEAKKKQQEEEQQELAREESERKKKSASIRKEIEKEGGKMPTKADVDRLLIELGKSNDGVGGEWSYWQVMKVLHALSKDMK